MVSPSRPYPVSTPLTRSDLSGEGEERGCVVTVSGEGGRAVFVLLIGGCLIGNEINVPLSTSRKSIQKIKVNFSFRFIKKNASLMIDSLDRINIISCFAHLVTSGTSLTSLTCSVK